MRSQSTLVQEKGFIPIMARRGRGGAEAGKNVVEKAIEQVGGSPAELARRLSEYMNEEITRQRVHGWRLRGIFPRDVLVAVERLTGISVVELATAKPKDRDHGNIVNRAIRLLGEDANAASLAAAITKISGRRITRQMVNGWQATGQFPTDVGAYVHIITHIPIRDLVLPRSKKRGG